MAELGVPGASLALIGEGQVVWARGFGLRRGRSSEPVTATTIFEAASLSKPLFANLIMQLSQAGKLNLDVPLWNYFQYKDLAGEAAARTLTTRHILSQTSGLPNWRSGGSPLQFIAKPGERFTYSGEAFVFLQLAVERLAQTPIGELMRRSVMAPLGMAESSYVWRVDYESRGAQGHEMDGTAIEKGKPERGNVAWSLHTSSPEYARFVASLLSGEQSRLQRSWLRDAFSPHIDVADGLSWGLAWGLSGPDGRDTFWHWGSNPGYRCFAVGSRETGLGVVVMTNQARGMGVCREVVRIALGYDHPAFSWPELQDNG
jgi:CubicO group peptidase (beta-lactamase class C family)